MRTPVSYTHLDVYKRQIDIQLGNLAEGGKKSSGSPVRWGKGLFFNFLYLYYAILLYFYRVFILKRY